MIILHFDFYFYTVFTSYSGTWIISSSILQNFYRSPIWTLRNWIPMWSIHQLFMCALMAFLVFKFSKLRKSTRGLPSSDFDTTCVITSWIVLHSVQLLMQYLPDCLTAVCCSPLILTLPVLRILILYFIYVPVINFSALWTSFNQEIIPVRFKIGLN